MNKNMLMNKKDILNAINRIADEVLSQNPNAAELAVIGIRERGDIIAKRIVKKIKKLTDVDVPLGILDITFYRDDIGVNPQGPDIKKTDMNFDVTNKVVILVDDVLFTGRSVRAGIDAIIDFGRPKKIQLAVLIDRGLREFPIHADYMGEEIKTRIKDDVIVKLKDMDEDEEVYLVKNKK